MRRRQLKRLWARLISAQHFWTGGLETARPGCYEAVVIARAVGFRMLAASVMRRLSPSSITLGAGQNRAASMSRKIVAGQEKLSGWGETLAELLFTEGQIVCLGCDQAADEDPL